MRRVMQCRGEGRMQKGFTKTQMRANSANNGGCAGMRVCLGWRRRWWADPMSIGPKPESAARSRE